MLHVSCGNASPLIHESDNRRSGRPPILVGMAAERTKIATRLWQLRADKGWTLREASLATQGVLLPSRISNYEQGIREVGTQEAHLLGKLYGTSAAHVLCLDDDNPVLSSAERQHINNLRALPENLRHEAIRHVHTLALAYKSPAADSRVPKAFAAPEKPRPVIKRRRTA